MLPFNIYIKLVNDAAVATMRPVKSLDIWEGATNPFHEDGLFSVSTFGRVGDERRDRQFGFIPLKVTVFHPIIYNALCALKALYKGIMNSTAYAVWDDELKDFVPATEITGETVFPFFTKHWSKIDHRQPKSPVRQPRIEVVNKYIKEALTDKILVIPAGLRDLDIGEDGRHRQDPINDLYRKVISTNNLISSTYYNNNDSSLDGSRRSI